MSDYLRKTSRDPKAATQLAANLYPHPEPKPSGPQGPSRRDAPEPGGAEPGGDRRDRTDDLMLAKHALSQLSYVP